MLRRKPPSELGELVDTHRPLHPVLGWATIVLTALVLTPFAMNAEPAPLPVYGVVFVLLCYGEALVFAPQLLLEHRLYEHGIVLRTLVVGTPIYVIPHCTVRADWLHSVAGQPGSDSSETTPHRRKCLATRPSVRLFGLAPARARLLGKGRISWSEATSPHPGPLPGRAGNPPARQDWEIDYRDAERHLALLRRTVLASQQRGMARPGDTTPPAPR